MHLSIPVYHNFQHRLNNWYAKVVFLKFPSEMFGIVGDSDASNLELSVQCNTDIHNTKINTHLLPLF